MLGGYLTVVGAVRWHIEPLFWTGVVLVPVAFVLEYPAWRTRRQPAPGRPGSSDRPGHSAA